MWRWEGRGWALKIQGWEHFPRKKCRVTDMSKGTRTFYQNKHWCLGALPSGDSFSSPLRYEYITFPHYRKELPRQQNAIIFTTSAPAALPFILGEISPVVALLTADEAQLKNLFRTSSNFPQKENSKSEPRSSESGFINRNHHQQHQQKLFLANFLHMVYFLCLF